MNCTHCPTTGLFSLYASHLRRIPRGRAFLRQATPEHDSGKGHEGMVRKMSTQKLRKVRVRETFKHRHMMNSGTMLFRHAWELPRQVSQGGTEVRNIVAMEPFQHDLGHDLGLPVQSQFPKLLQLWKAGLPT